MQNTDNPDIPDNDEPLNVEVPINPDKWSEIIKDLGQVIVKHTPKSISTKEDYEQFYTLMTAMMFCTAVYGIPHVTIQNFQINALTQYTLAEKSDTRFWNKKEKSTIN